MTTSFISPSSPSPLSKCNNNIYAAKCPLQEGWCVSAGNIRFLSAKVIPSLSFESFWPNSSIYEARFTCPTTKWNCSASLSCASNIGLLIRFFWFNSNGYFHKYTKQNQLWRIEWTQAFDFKKPCKEHGLFFLSEMFTKEWIIAVVIYSKFPKDY